MSPQTEENPLESVTIFLHLFKVKGAGHVEGQGASACEAAVAAGDLGRGAAGSLVGA